MKQSNKEKRGIYNVSFNKKKTTPINAELESIENAIIDYVIHYVKGWRNIRRDKGLGAEHIKLHLEKGSQGEITLEELLNLGNSIREYLRVFDEPYLEDLNKNGKVYEWENSEGVRFRLATDKTKWEGLIPPLSPSDETIITFYSDRNLNERMEFKNPNVAKYYASRESTKDNKETNRLLTNYSETEYGERQGRGEQGQLRREFNDRDFLRPANESIAQINAHNDEMETISSKLDSAERMHENLQKDLAELNNQSKAQHNEARETEVDKDDILRRM